MNLVSYLNYLTLTNSACVWCVSSSGRAQQCKEKHSESSTTHCPMGRRMRTYAERSHPHRIHSLLLLVGYQARELGREGTTIMRRPLLIFALADARHAQFFDVPPAH